MPHATYPRCPPMSRPASPPLGFITIPRGQSTADCPKSAIIISPKTERIICTSEKDYRRWSWSEVKEVIRINRIDLFQRTPTDLLRYIEFKHYLTKTFGSILNFIQHERLHWPSIEPSGQAAFANPADYRILYNDWPYGIDLDIVHLVVWTKFRFEDDVSTGDLTSSARAEIEKFVQRTFCGGSGGSGGSGGVERESLVWFRNWQSLKSVHALEHFHVMIYKPEAEFLRRITGGDMSMCEKLKNGKAAP